MQVRHRINSINVNIYAYAALLAEVVLFHRKVLFAAGYLLPWDFRVVHLPLATFVADSLARGAMPLWDPFTYCGVPIFANIQTALFYPPVLAATAAGAWLGAELLPRLLAIAAVIQIFFAGACTYSLLRRLGARPAAAWIAGTVYEAGFFFASQAEHLGAIQGAAWLPLAWWCVVELGEGLRWRRLALLAMALAMTVLAGLPQVAVAVFGSVLVLAVLMTAFRLARRTLPLHVLMAWGWALLIAAVQIVPTIELTRHSVAKYRAEWLGTGGGIKPAALWSLVNPNYWSVFDLAKFHGPSDPTFLYLYSSLLGLALALAAMFWKPDRWRRVFAALTIAACIWMLGDSTPVGRWIFEALPVGIRIGLHFEFTICVFALGLAVLAGLGAERFLRGARWQVAVGIVIAADLLLAGSDRPFNTASLAAEPGITHDSVDGNRELITRLRTLTATAMPPYRIDTTAGLYLWASSAPLMEIPTANGCDPLAPERMIQVRLSFAPGKRWGTCYQVVNAGSSVLGLANVKYLVSRGQSGGYRIDENTHVLPRFFLVRQVRAAGGLAEAERALQAADFDPAQTAIVESPAAELPRPETAGSVEVVSYAASELAVRTHSTGPSFLVASEAWYPGWEATLDGRPTRLYITDVAFRGVAVPAGDHRIAMQFVPRILYRSAVVSLIALLAVAFVLLSGARTRACRVGTLAGARPQVSR